jgi:hypothetical protein
MTQSTKIWFKSNVAAAFILIMQGFVQGFRMFQKRKPGYALNACSYALNARYFCFI